MAGFGAEPQFKITHKLFRRALKLMYARYALGLPLIGMGVIGFVVSLQCIFRYKHLD